MATLFLQKCHVYCSILRRRVKVLALACQNPPVKTFDLSLRNANGT